MRLNAWLAARGGRILVFAITVFGLTFEFLGGSTPDWIQTAYRMSPPGTYVLFEPVVVSDALGRTHLVWSQDSSRPCCQEGGYSVLNYARFDGTTWVGPVEIQRLPGFRIERSGAWVDAAGMVHLVWVQREGTPAVYYTSLPVALSLVPPLSLTRTRLSVSDRIGTDALKIGVDQAGTIHLLSKSRQLGVQHSKSSNQGQSWTQPVRIDLERPDGFYPDIVQFTLDGQNGLHAAWNELDGNAVSRRLRYSTSRNAGASWALPFTADEFNPATDDPLTRSVEAPVGLVTLGNEVHLVWIGGPPGAPKGVGRKHRFSEDRGTTWGPAQESILGGIWGVQNGDGVAVDGSGRIHWAGLARKFVGPGTLWEGIWGGFWDGVSWSDPREVVTILPPGGDSTRLGATPEGGLVAAFRNQPRPEQLFATHTAAPVFYFPHFGDGGGFSMLFALSNPSGERATGELTVFDENGTPGSLPFEGGAAGTIPIEIGPKGTVVLRTRGSSTPVKTGFVRVSTDQPEVTGVAVFQRTNGTEASVLPVRPARRFSLAVERSTSVQTGVAFVRHTPAQPILLSLFDLQGNLLGVTESTGSVKEAKFVEEQFPGLVPQSFRGLLVIESEALISAVGLRFGSGVLSTIPVPDVDDPEAGGTFLFPHFGDGSGVSMLVALSNLSSNSGSGELTVLNPDGSLGEVPLAEGELSQAVLDLAPHATRFFESLGTSNPLRTGYLQVEPNLSRINGVAIFRYSDGREASVLPSYPGRRIALFAERSASMDSGIAIVRRSGHPVSLRLYDLAGALQGSVNFPYGEGRFHNALFLQELFTLGTEFRGLLLVESEGDVAAVGLRFGGNTLSTIPAVRLE